MPGTREEHVTTGLKYSELSYSLRNGVWSIKKKKKKEYEHQLKRIEEGWEVCGEKREILCSLNTEFPSHLAWYPELGELTIRARLGDSISALGEKELGLWLGGVGWGRRGCWGKRQCFKHFYHLFPGGKGTS